VQAIIRGSREHVSSEILDEADSPVVEEAFERTTLAISRDKIVKGEFFLYYIQPNVASCIFPFILHILILCE